METNVMNRIKTFDDAVNELGNDHPFIKAYNVLLKNGFDQQKDIDALFKIRIITAALNEGWEPQFTKKEKRYYPYFHFYTQQQIDGMSKYQRGHVFLLEKPIGDYVGAAYMFSIDVPPGAAAYVGSQLCFKTSELADYAGKNFIRFYAIFCMGR